MTTPGLACMSGGLAPEGFLYGSSMGMVFQTLHALHTAGWDDVTLSGPQVRAWAVGMGSVIS